MSRCQMAVIARVTGCSGSAGSLYLKLERRSLLGFGYGSLRVHSSLVSSSNLEEAHSEGSQPEGTAGAGVASDSGVKVSW